MDKLCGAVIRSADESLLPEVYAVEVESFENPYPFWYLVLLLKLATEKYFLVSLSQNGTVDGYIVGVPHRKGLMHIASVAVRQKCRRRYVGLALLHSLFEVAESEGFSTFILEVELHNYGAQRLYLSAGFRPAKIIPSYYGPGRHAVLMLRVAR
ncbi:MAG: N-acetyltransferase [Thermoproteota archaeon]